MEFKRWCHWIFRAIKQCITIYTNICISSTSLSSTPTIIRKLGTKTKIYILNRPVVVYVNDADSLKIVKHKYIFYKFPVKKTLNCMKKCDAKWLQKQTTKNFRHKKNGKKLKAKTQRVFKYELTK